MNASAKSVYANKEMQYFKYNMEEELFFSNPTQNFVFYRYKLPKLDVAASHMFAQAYRPNLTYDQALALDPNSPSYQPVAPIFFVNLIPREDSLIVIIGHVKGIYGALEGLRIDALGRLSNRIVIKLISDILVRRIDTWAMSIELYERLIFQEKIKQYLKFRSDYLPKSKIRSFFNPYKKYGLFEIPRSLAQTLREANRWELWRFMIPFNLFDGVL